MAEATNKKDNQKETILKVLRYIRKYWIYVGVSLMLAALTVAATLYIPILTGDAVDLLLGPGMVDMQGIFAVINKIIMMIKPKLFKNV